MMEQLELRAPGRSGEVRTGRERAARVVDEEGRGRWCEARCSRDVGS